MSGQNALKESYIEELRTNGYIDLATASDDIDPVFEEFRSFLELCDEPGGQKFADAITYTPDDVHNGGDYFVNRRRVGDINPYAINKAPSTEDKDVAHIGPVSLLRAEAVLGKRGVPAIMRQFLTSCVELHHINRAEVGPVFEVFGIKDIMLAEDPEDDIFVDRFLRYLSSNISHKAGLHLDRSAFTAARKETTPGLVGTPANNAQRIPMSISELDAIEARANATPVHHTPGHIKLFAGAGYNRFSDDVYNINGELPLFMHGVLNLVPDEERFARVGFMHPHLKAARAMNYLIPRASETGIEGIRAYLEELYGAEESVA